MSEKKELLFSVTKKDLEVRSYSSKKAGGQHANRHPNGQVVKHKASGAEGRCQDHRSKAQNLKVALQRLVASKKFKAWARIEAAKATGEIDEQLHRWMQPENMKVETFDPEEE